MRSDSPCLKVFGTVGMGRWPFDRFVQAVDALSDDHDVFLQTGTSAYAPSCPHVDFIPYDEVQRRISDADVVITHAGNSVRLVQRSGKVPIAIARQASRGEMSNDHQVAYLRTEEQAGRVIAVWDVSLLKGYVTQYAERARQLGDDRALAAPTDPKEVADVLDSVCADLLGESADEDPFARDPLRRYSFAWRHLAHVSGPHLDVGVGAGDFAGPFATATGREVHAVDPNEGYVDEVRRRFPHIAVRHCSQVSPLPYVNGTFTSASLLDVLEHCRSERDLLREVHRVLASEGRLLVTVPHRHVFSMLDPDNAKYRFPRLHKFVYVRRFGSAAYERRFQDVSDGLFGDVSVERGWHTNYRASDLLGLLRETGFEPVLVEGANLFWRWLHIPYLIGPPRLRSVLGAGILLDGKLFRNSSLAANLFVVARRLP